MARSKIDIVRLDPLVSLPESLNIQNLAAFDVGPDGGIYFAFAAPERTFNFSFPGGSVGIAKDLHATPYRLLCFRDGAWDFDLTISRERFSVHHVQPLGDDMLLLASARSQYRGRGDFDKNGRIYHRNGAFVRGILLGDGIQSVQTTRSQEIWTSFFDEGVFGNLGWKDPVGAPGLIAWSATGEKLYQFSPKFGLDSICDCYALNVDSNEIVWLYYYTEFPLVRLVNREIDGVWRMPIKGSHVFAVFYNSILMDSGYKDHDTFCLFSLEDGGSARPRRRIQINGPEGKLRIDRVIGRRDSLFFLSGSEVYRLPVTTVLGS